jgi:hypothetical protein
VPQPREPAPRRGSVPRLRRLNRTIGGVGAIHPAASLRLAAPWGKMCPMGKSARHPLGPSSDRAKRRRRSRISESAGASFPPDARSRSVACGAVPRVQVGAWTPLVVSVGTGTTRTVRQL